MSLSLQLLFHSPRTGVNRIEYNAFAFANRNRWLSSSGIAKPAASDLWKLDVVQRTRIDTYNLIMFFFLVLHLRAAGWLASNKNKFHFETKSALAQHIDTIGPGRWWYWIRFLLIAHIYNTLLLLLLKFEKNINNARVLFKRNYESRVESSESLRFCSLFCLDEDYGSVTNYGPGNRVNRALCGHLSWAIKHFVAFCFVCNT